MIAHITREELLRRLSETEMANGFVNRILFICARRARVLPFGGPQVDAAEIICDLKQAVQCALKMGDSEVKFNSEASKLWASVYPALSEGSPGMFGAVTSRADPHVLRLSLIYALLDRASTIDAKHLKAGLAVWNRAEQSTRFIWADTLGDPAADALLRALRAAGSAGMTRWDITNHFGRNKTATELDRALAVLAERGLIRFEREDTGGRLATRYWAL